MSTTEKKRPLAQAIRDAEAFRTLFDGTFETWEIAGSVRRKRPEVADIEHVVIPRFGDVVIPGTMFSERGNLLWDRLGGLIGGTLTKHVYGATGFRWGEKYRGVDYRGFNNEVFCADEDNFGSVLAIRTGPADFSRKLVTDMQGKGYRNRDGYVWNWRDWNCTCGWLGPEPVRLSGIGVAKWAIDPDGRDGGPFAMACPNCGHHDGINPARVSVPDERKYLELCGVGWVEPENRV